MKILIYCVAFIFPIVTMILVIIWFIGTRKSDKSFQEQLIYLNNAIDKLKVSDDNFRFINAKFAEINRCEKRNHDQLEEAFKKFVFKYKDVNEKIVKEYLKKIA